MNTFKETFKKHLAVNLLLIIIPTFLQIFILILYPLEATHKWTLIVPYYVTCPIAIIANISSVLLFNLIICNIQKDKKIICYIVIAVIIGTFIFFNILQLIASFMDIDWATRLQAQLSTSPQLFILWIFTSIIATLAILMTCMFFIRRHIQLYKQAEAAK